MEVGVPNWNWLRHRPAEPPTSLEVGFGIEKIWMPKKKSANLTCSHKNWVQEQADALAAVVGYLELTNQSFPVPDLPREVLRLMSYIKNPVDTTWPKPLCKAIFPSISISIYIYIICCQDQSWCRQSNWRPWSQFSFGPETAWFCCQKG